MTLFTRRPAVDSFLHNRAAELAERAAHARAVRHAESLAIRNAPTAARLAVRHALAVAADLATAERAHAARLVYATDSAARRAFR